MEHEKQPPERRNDSNKAGTPLIPGDPPHPGDRATVHLRHSPLKLLLVWKTADIKDTCGAELHEGGIYHLVATVQGVADVAAGEVGVTRCRLTPMSDARSIL